MVDRIDCRDSSLLLAFTFTEGMISLEYCALSSPPCIIETLRGRPALNVIGFTLVCGARLEQSAAGMRAGSACRSRHYRSLTISTIVRSSTLDSDVVMRHVTR